MSKQEMKASTRSLMCSGCRESVPVLFPEHIASLSQINVKNVEAVDLAGRHTDLMGGGIGSKQDVDMLWV
jgi:hypothetical protein